MSRDAVIRRMHAQGLGRADIAARLCCRLQAVDAVLLAAATSKAESVTEAPGAAAMAPVWSPAEIQILRDGYAEKLSRRVIATHLPGRSLSAIGYKAGELGLLQAPSPWTDEEIARLRDLYVPGASPRLVAEQLGRPLKGVQTKACELGLNLRQKWTDADREALIAAEANGCRLVDVARDLGRPYANVAKVAEKLGLSFKPAPKQAAPRPVRERAAPSPMVGPFIVMLAAANIAQRLEAAVAKATAAAQRREVERKPKCPTSKPARIAPSAAPARAPEPVLPTPPAPAPTPKPAPTLTPNPAPTPKPAPARAPAPTPLKPLRMPARPARIPTLGAKAAERDLIARQTADFEARNGGASTAVDFGPDQPAVDALRATFNIVAKVNTRGKPWLLSKPWLVNGSPRTTEEMWKQANAERARRNLPPISRKELANA